MSRLRPPRLPRSRHGNLSNPLRYGNPSSQLTRGTCRGMGIRQTGSHVAPVLTPGPDITSEWPLVRPYSVMMCAESREASSGSVFLINKLTKQVTRTTHRQETETMPLGEGSKGSDIYRAGNQGGDESK
jgi:hypothetical protein